MNRTYDLQELIVALLSGRKMSLDTVVARAELNFEWISQTLQFNAETIYRFRMDNNSENTCDYLSEPVLKHRGTLVYSYTDSTDLVDIQKKMQQGKGPGYARWAKSFNLKQMAQTVLYLQEHKLYDYEELSKKVEASKEQFNILSAQIKDAEKRMTEISVMKTQLINYSETRQVYADYREAGYSKKYLSEHEADIILHKAAKKYLDDVGLKHFPSIKQLDTEYAELLSKKKELYTAYRKAKEESRELLTAKANVDRILGIEKDDVPEKEAPSETRS